MQARLFTTEYRYKREDGLAVLKLKLQEMNFDEITRLVIAYREERNRDYLEWRKTINQRG